MTLEGHHGETIYFSDRPQRIFGEAPTQQFLDGLGFSPANPPNAALVTDNAAGEDVVVVLELITPAYDEATGTVTYGANILSEYEGEGLAHVAAQQQDAALPEEFGRASLFIDDCPNITDCGVYRCAEGDYGVCGEWYVGAIPGGPYPTCWSLKTLACGSCDPALFLKPSEIYGDLVALCNQTYPDCQGACVTG